MDKKRTELKNGFAVCFEKNYPHVAPVIMSRHRAEHSAWRIHDSLEFPEHNKVRRLVEGRPGEVRGRPPQLKLA